MWGSLERWNGGATLVADRSRVLRLLQLRFGPFNGTPVQCGGGQREGPVKMSHYIRAKFFDQLFQVFVLRFR